MARKFHDIFEAIHETDDIKVLRKFIHEIDCKDEDGWTPLMNVVNQYENNIELVRFFLSFNSNINYQNKDGCSAIYLAVDNGDIEMVKYLVANGAKTNIC